MFDNSFPVRILVVSSMHSARAKYMNILITTSSLLFFFNKILVLTGKPLQRTLGWLLGTFAAVLFIVYFFLIGTHILSVLEIGLVLLMGYRFFAKEETNKKVEYLLGAVTAGMVIVLAYLTHVGMMTWMQCLAAFGMLLGTYFLISVSQVVGSDIEIRERIGWLLYGVGHMATSYIGYQKGEWIFFAFQVWQLLLCLVGCVYARREVRAEATKCVLVFGAVLLSLSLLAIIITSIYN